jgi:hypothetical protein
MAVQAGTSPGGAAPAGVRVMRRAVRPTAARRYLLWRYLSSTSPPGKSSIGSAWWAGAAFWAYPEEAVWWWGAPTGLLSGEPRWRR